MDEMHPSTPKSFSQDPNRLSLALGFMTGIALLSTVGFFVLLTRVNGTKGTTKTNTQAAVADTNTADNAEPTGPVQLPTITENDHILGDFNAPVTIVEFSDIQCPYCKNFHPTLEQIVKDYPGKVRWVFKQFPLETIHSNAKPAALATECAGEQGKFWEFLDAAYENQSLLGADFYTSTAKTLKLNLSTFQKCLDDQKYISRITSDVAEATTAGVAGTPTTFVNGQLVPGGAVSYASLKSIVDAAIAAAQ